MMTAIAAASRETGNKNVFMKALRWMFEFFKAARSTEVRGTGTLAFCEEIQNP
jgi:hypothetical protein